LSLFSIAQVSFIMQEPVINQSANPEANVSQVSAKSWMDGLEMAGVAVSVAGAIGSAVMQQVAFAAIPLSLTAAVSLANRRRWDQALAQSQQTSTAQVIAQQQQQRSQIIDQATGFDLKLTEVTGQIDALKAEMTQQCEALSAKDSDISTALEKLWQIDRCTQAIRTNPDDAELFYQRGEIRQSLSRTEDSYLAIADYTQAIELEPTLAKAYFNRGMLRSALNERRMAGEDLRAAAKAFFDQGDMERYAEAKQLSESIYEKTEGRTEPEGTDAQLFTTNLFV
jgi:tetratricopeptide (TPR) repeat protein